MKAKNFWMIVLLAIFAATLFYDCGKVGPTTPEPPPPPDDSKYYDLQIEYIRPEILNPGYEGYIPGVLLYTPEGCYGYEAFTRIDNYHFKCEFEHVKAGLNGDYYFSQIDQARFNGLDYSSWMVGDIYIVTVKQTGIAKELKDVRPYTLSTNPNQGPYAKAAFFRLTKEGVIISDAH